MNRDMGGLGDHLAPSIEDSAGVIPALFDVGRMSGPTQGDPHLLGNRGEEVLEDL